MLDCGILIRPEFDLEPTLLKDWRSPFQRSLIVRLGTAMAFIALPALIGMTSSVIIAQAIRGSAQAVNLVGSLRMQSYQMAAYRLRIGEGMSVPQSPQLKQAIAKFDRTLELPLLRQALAESSPVGGKRYQTIVEQWRTEIRPLFAAEPDKIQSLASVESFVGTIDAAVSDIEHYAERRIELLRFISGSTLFFTIVVIFLVIHLVRADLLLPLRDLLGVAERLGRGDLEAKTVHTGPDELGRLGRAFNHMSSELAKLYENLAARVAEKTASLERSNRSLELLYHSIARLYNGAVSPETYSILLRDIEQLVGTGRGSACLIEGNGERASLLASTLDPRRQDADLCKLSNCAECIGSGTSEMRELAGHTVLSLPLRDTEQQHGILQLELPVGTQLEPWQLQLLEALCRHIGIAIGTTRRAEQGRRVSLLEERAVIARELHDSLAQSLSYMRIQVSRLQTAIESEPNADAREILAELKHGLNSAYRELRELLTTFRLKIEDGGLATALEKTAAEFSARSGLKIELAVHLTGCTLEPSEQIHILQIAREALSNILHHAKASQASIVVERGAEQTVTMTLDDNGIGIDHRPAAIHHYGLSIMEERTRSLDGVLSVRQKPLGGTRVLLHFTPSCFRRQGSTIVSSAHDV